MKNKRLWLSVALTVLVVVCAMLILSRINEARSNAAPAGSLPPRYRHSRLTIVRRGCNQ